MEAKIILFLDIETKNKEDMYWCVDLLKNTTYTNLNSLGLEMNLKSDEIQVYPLLGEDFAGYQFHLDIQEQKKMDVYVKQDGKILVIMSALNPDSGKWEILNEWSSPISTQELNEKFGDLIQLLR
jgi:hypothetical protein